MYKWPEIDSIDRFGFFPFPKWIIESKLWAALPKSGKSVFPAIASFRNNKTGIAKPTEKTISIVCGRTIKTVREGALCSQRALPFFKITKGATSHGQLRNEYRIQLNREEDYLALRKCVFDFGNWSIVKPSAAALYPVMLFFSKMDPYDNGGDEAEVGKERYKNREFEFCVAKKSVMAEYAGFDLRSINEALKSLTEANLIEEVNYGIWKVFLTPCPIRSK